MMCTLLKTIANFGKLQMKTVDCRKTPPVSIFAIIRIEAEKEMKIRNWLPFEIGLFPNFKKIGHGQVFGVVVQSCLYCYKHHEIMLRKQFQQTVHRKLALKPSTSFSQAKTKIS